MWWIPEGAQVSIANFVCRALQERLVGEVYWVVPDATFATRSNRSALRRQVAEVIARCPGPPAPVENLGDQLRTRVLDRPFVICRLGALPGLRDPVLLDIDVDYLMIPRVAFGEPDVHSPVPWVWPADLVARWQARHIEADLVTIAYSVEGGHTPIHWKYLGDELAARLTGPASRERLACFDRMRAALEALERHDAPRAEALFREIGDAMGAAPHMHLAFALVDRDRISEAQAHYRRALELDPSYRTPYASPGVTLFFSGDWRAAAVAFERSARLDPADGYARLGVGWAAALRGDWADAEGHARRALELDGGMVDAQRLLGRSLSKQGRLLEAIRAYEASLKLALAGARPLDGVIATGGAADALVDADHPLAHARLARLYEQAGDLARAAVGYQIAIAGGYSSPSVHLRLAALLAGQRRWAAAGRHLVAGARQLPAAVRRRLRRPRRT
jgi:tetratricopeptide (TPR) repeat protein